MTPDHLAQVQMSFALETRVHALNVVQIGMAACNAMPSELFISASHCTWMRPAC